MQLRDSGLANSNLPKSSENSINNFSLSLAKSEFGNPHSKVVNLLFLLHYLGLTSFLYAPVIILFDKIALRIMPNCLLPGQFFNDALTIL